ncbi:50S ribosomal protein L30e [Candidatus Micrarchaeota archaeon]|nr:50S ribosomal protein L30e [Candidatus Micrarchaeota archaeon]
MTEEEKEETKDTEEASEEKVEESTEQENEDDYKPKKRVIRRKKSKKDKEHPLSSAIRLAVESGKVDFGSRKGLKNSVLGKVKLFVLASNIPSDVKDDILKYSKSSETPIIEFDGNNMELGSICGKPFSVSLLSVYDVGASNLLELVKKK